MPRIEPVPYEKLDAESRAAMEEGKANGMYTTTLPIQIFAHSPVAFRALDQGYKALYKTGVLDHRIQELVRIRSAQINGCAPCSSSRKDASISDEDVACMIEADQGSYSQKEKLALDFVSRLANDHYSIDDDTFKALAEEYSTPEILELAAFCAQSLGMHRLMHALDVLGSSEPVISYVDKSVE